jgi:hypothetical protein
MKRVHHTNTEEANACIRSSSIACCQKWMTIVGNIFKLSACPTCFKKTMEESISNAYKKRKSERKEKKKERREAKKKSKNEKEVSSVTSQTKDKEKKSDTPKQDLRSSAPEYVTKDLYGSQCIITVGDISKPEESQPNPILIESSPLYAKEVLDPFEDKDTDTESSEQFIKEVINYSIQSDDDCMVVASQTIDEQSTAMPFFDLNEKDLEIKEEEEFQIQEFSHMPPIKNKYNVGISRRYDLNFFLQNGILQNGDHLVLRYFSHRPKEEHTCRMKIVDNKIEYSIQERNLLTNNFYDIPQIRADNKRWKNTFVYRNEKECGTVESLTRKWRNDL